MKKSILLAVIAALYAAGASAQGNKYQKRSGNVSFDGIQVKVIVNPDQGSFQIGESRFISPVLATNADHVMTAKTRVGIMTWEETLTATIFLDGGDGGNIEGFQEYRCDDVRITIVRTKDDGSQTVIKNECAFLE